MRTRTARCARMAISCFRLTEPGRMPDAGSTAHPRLGNSEFGIRNYHPPPRRDHNVKKLNVRTFRPTSGTDPSAPSLCSSGRDDKLEGRGQVERTARQRMCHSERGLRPSRGICVVADRVSSIRRLGEVYGPICVHLRYLRFLRGRRGGIPNSEFRIPTSSIDHPYHQQPSSRTLSR